MMAQRGEETSDQMLRRLQKLRKSVMKSLSEVKGSNIDELKHEDASLDGLTTEATSGETAAQANENTKHSRSRSQNKKTSRQSTVRTTTASKAQHTSRGKENAPVSNAAQNDGPNQDNQNAQPSYLDLEHQKRVEELRELYHARLTDFLREIYDNSSYATSSKYKVDRIEKLWRGKTREEEENEYRQYFRPNAFDEIYQKAVADSLAQSKRQEVQKEFQDGGNITQQPAKSNTDAQEGAKRDEKSSHTTKGSAKATQEQREKIMNEEEPSMVELEPVETTVSRQTKEVEDALEAEALEKALRQECEPSIPGIPSSFVKRSGGLSWHLGEGHIANWADSSSRRQSAKTANGGTKVHSQQRERESSLKSSTAKARESAATARRPSFVPRINGQPIFTLSSRLKAYQKRKASKPDKGIRSCAMGIGYVGVAAGEAGHSSVRGKGHTVTGTGLDEKELERRRLLAEVKREERLVEERKRQHESMQRRREFERQRKERLRQQLEEERQRQEREASAMIQAQFRKAQKEIEWQQKKLQDLKQAQARLVRREHSLVESFLSAARQTKPKPTSNSTISESTKRLTLSQKASRIGPSDSQSHDKRLQNALSSSKRLSVSVPHQGARQNVSSVVSSREKGSSSGSARAVQRENSGYSKQPSSRNAEGRRLKDVDLDEFFQKQKPETVAKTSKNQRTSTKKGSKRKQKQTTQTKKPEGSERVEEDSLWQSDFEHLEEKHFEGPDDSLNESSFLAKDTDRIEEEAQDQSGLFGTSYVDSILRDRTEVVMQQLLSYATTPAPALMTSEEGQKTMLRDLPDDSPEMKVLLSLSRYLFGSLLKFNEMQPQAVEAFILLQGATSLRNYKCSRALKIFSMEGMEGLQAAASLLLPSCSDLKLLFFAGPLPILSQVVREGFEACPQICFSSSIAHADREYWRNSQKAVEAKEMTKPHLGQNSDRSVSSSVSPLFFTWRVILALVALGNVYRSPSTIQDFLDEDEAKRNERVTKWEKQGYDSVVFATPPVEQEELQRRAREGVIDDKEKLSAPEAGLEVFFPVSDLLWKATPCYLVEYTAKVDRNTDPSVAE